MRIGPIVDGQAELYSLPKLLPRIATPHTILQPLYADIQPTAPIPQIIRAVKSRLNIHVARRADIALILIDLEDLGTCAGAWAQELEHGLREGCSGYGINDFKVVIKHRMFENWLISDITAIRSLRRRFVLTEADVRQIEPNKADRVNAIRILKSAAQRTSYDKVADATRILTQADPMRMGANSRSFRRLLRVVENPKYARQSKKP
ncbi:MAG: DUF4276 family protein [Blastocatellia bacterium]